jgi:radical SAM-linked protein
MEIKNRLKDENISLSLPSQRVDRFDETIANILGGTRQGGLTFAPEAGTQRLRDIVNKGLTNEELLRGVKTAWEQGWDKVKLYFMIGLPGETDVDVVGIADTVRWLQQECSAKGRKRLHFNITISNFTPKPHTPFQWHSVAAAEFARKQRLLREEFRHIRGLKVNFTDVRLSAMEDFVGRGDRRLSSVIQRAWELGAGMDAWWESLDRAYAAWTQAIAESGLDWKYRQVENGEWNIFGTNEASIHPSSSIPHPSLEVPLPWDHLDTGIDKQWLKEDLQRALKAATVPDCSFEGCSHCGVCSTDFGHNVVVAPPKLPAFAGHFVPNQQRAQRVRVWLGKHGEMALVSHLDLIRLFDRVVRRAALSITFTGGFHPGPRIIPASALPLGVTSSGEIVDFELTEVMDLAVFRSKLEAQLPAEIPIYHVETVPVSSPAATQLLEKAEYLITVGVVQTDEPTAIQPFTLATWQAWVDAIQASDALWFQHTTKGGKAQDINLRDRLFDLKIEALVSDTSIVLRYLGSYRNDGTLLRPDHVLYMLEQVSQQELQLLHIHRDRLLLATLES